MRLRFLLFYSFLILASLSVAGCNAGPVLSQENTAVPAAAEISQEVEAANTPVAPASTATTPPTSTPTATLSPPSSPVPTSTPTITPTPWPTPTPVPALRRLTQGGCCVEPFFSPDSQQVLFLDKPGPMKPVGIYGIDITAPPLQHPELANEVIGFRSPDRTIVAAMDGDIVQFTNEETGESWAVDTGGNWPRFSPGAEQILWVATDTEGPYDQRQSDIWLAEIAGSSPQKLLSLYGGGYSGWFPDGQRLLLVGRDAPKSEQQTLLAYNLNNGRRTDLASFKRIRGIKLSPGGRWITFFVDFAEAPEQRGLWAVSSDGVTKKKLDVPAFGAYRWRDDDTLLFVPMRNSGEDSMQFWAIDVDSNQAAPLTTPETLSFSISNGDWNVSPDGNYVVFVNSIDQNIWLIALP